MKCSHTHPTRKTTSTLLFPVALLATLVLAAATLPAQEQSTSTSVETAPPSIPGVSQVRIVRLSQVNGPVQLDRGNGKPETAFVNLPIIAGERLQTEDGPRRSRV